jgi:hypothetical protein
MFLTKTTNILFNSRLTDMETCYKIFTKEVSKKIMPIRSKRFEIEPEITTKIIKAGYRILELPITYNARSITDGKKVSWKDGIDAFFFLIRKKL